MKLFAGEFLGMLVEYRICWIAGRFGGGKTSFALCTALWLVANGYAKKILSNSPTDLAMTNPRDAYDSVVVIDEGWQFKQEAVEKYAAFVRKINNYLLFPTVWPPHPQFCNFYVQRVFDATCVGIPAWFYRWVLRTRVYNEKGTIVLWQPGPIFSHMNTLKVTVEDGGIANAIQWSIDNEISKEAVQDYTLWQRERIQSEGSGIGQGQIGIANSNPITRAARAIGDSAENFASSTEQLTVSLEQLRERLARLRH